MKKSLFLSLFCAGVSLTASAQNFSVNPHFYDSIGGSTGYAFHFEGTAAFTDSMEVFYTVRTNDSIPELLYGSSVDFTDSLLVFPSNFSYDTVSHVFEIGLGNYAVKELILELYSVIAGETREHLLMNIHRIETTPEDEE